MGTTDTGTWKLIIYPLIIVFVLALVLSFVIYPFVSNGVAITQEENIANSNSALGLSLSNTIIATINTGNPFNVTSIDILGFFDIPIPNAFSLLGDGGKQFILNELVTLTYIPLWLLVPLLIIFIISFVIALWYLIASLIP